MPSTVTIEGRTFGLGAKPSPKDIRDYTLADHRPDLLYAGQMLPTKVDLRANYPAMVIRDQGSQGSCVGFGTSRTFEAVAAKLGIYFKTSEAFTYYQARLYEGWQSQDSGAYVRDGIKAFYTAGGCPLGDMPYSDRSYAVAPTTLAYADAKTHLATKYIAVPIDDNQIKTVLAAGYPVVLGYTVYSNFFYPQAPLYIIPSPTGSIAGGHCTPLWGYDDTLSPETIYLSPNSWGTSWGEGGYHRMTSSYIKRLASDAWMISEIAGGGPPPPPPPPSPVTVTKVFTQTMFSDGTQKTVVAYP